jgi:hypothetical protein
MHVWEVSKICVDKPLNTMNSASPNLERSGFQRNVGFEAEARSTQVRKVRLCGKSNPDLLFVPDDPCARIITGGQEIDTTVDVVLVKEVSVVVDSHSQTAKTTTHGSTSVLSTDFSATPSHLAILESSLHADTADRRGPDIVAQNIPSPKATGGAPRSQLGRSLPPPLQSGGPLKETEFPIESSLRKTWSCSDLAKRRQDKASSLVLAAMPEIAREAPRMRPLTILRNPHRSAEPRRWIGSPLRGSTPAVLIDVSDNE